MAQSNTRPGELISGINVTPLVDVVLVLLIVLMVSASYTVSKAVPLDLPTASTGESKSLPMAVSVDASGALFLDGSSIQVEQLQEQIRARKANGQNSAMIAADGKTPHRFVNLVIDLLRREGLTQFAINVAPEDLK